MRMADPRLQVAYDIATKITNDQNEAVNQIRNRTISLTGSATLFISFSASLGLINTGPKNGVPLWIAITLMLLLVAILVLVLVALWPLVFTLAANPKSVLETIDQGKTEDQILRYLTEGMSNASSSNSRRLQEKSNSARAIVILVIAAAILILTNVLIS
jgi:hypothetical protein